MKAEAKGSRPFDHPKRSWHSGCAPVFQAGDASSILAERSMSKNQYPEYKRDRKNRHHERALAYLGGRCVECGATENLQFDHIDPKTKCFNISGSLNSSWATIVKELDKCQLLCDLHHKDKSAAERSVEHGGGVSGKRNCPCEPCKAQKADYMRYYKAAHRKTARVRVQEHGGGTQGIRNCKCDACRMRRAAYQRERGYGRKGL